MKYEKKDTLTKKYIAIIILSIFVVICLIAWCIGFRPVINEDAIMYWEGFGFVIQSLVAIGSLGAIFAIFFTSNKQLKKQSEIQEQNVRIQLIHERHDVFNQTKQIFDYLQLHEYSVWKLLIACMAGKEISISKNITFQKVKHLFGVLHYQKAEDLYKEANQISSISHKMNKIYDYIINRVTNGKRFKKIVDDYKNPMNPMNDECLFISICDKFKITDEIQIESLPKDNYNYYAMHKEKEKMISQFKHRYKQLLDMLEEELYINDI